jgi:molybdopterin synthase catalytic subunit
MFRVTTEPLSVQQVNDLVKRPTDGAVVTFDGIVRNNFDGRSVRYLEYEAYAAMAEKKLAEINKIVKAPDFAKRIASEGLEPAGGTPEEFLARPIHGYIHQTMFIR